MTDSFSCAATGATNAADASPAATRTRAPRMPAAPSGGPRIRESARFRFRPPRLVLGCREPMADSASTHWLTRFFFFRLLGLVYASRFLVVVRQWLPLSARTGCCRRTTTSTRCGGRRAGPARASWRLPSLFWLSDSDAAFRLGGCVGLARLAGAARRLRQRAAPRRALVPLHVVRPRGRPLLRLRLGDPAARGRIPRDLPGAAVAHASLPARTLRPRRS